MNIYLFKKKNEGQKFKIILEVTALIGTYKYDLRSLTRNVVLV